MAQVAGAEDRQIYLGTGLPAVPERLLLAHSRGHVLFITGAGISKSADLPDFRELVVEVYERVDAGTHAVLETIPRDAHSQWAAATGELNAGQAAEVRRFIRGDYDVVLGMLERRMNALSLQVNNVRKAITDILFERSKAPAPIHKALANLADRGSASTIVTTNFDLLLEAASKGLRRRLSTLSLGAIPKPGDLWRKAGSTGLIKTRTRCESIP